MNSKLAQKAVKAALSCDWELAIELNKQILKDSPEDINALNRLAHAQAATGLIKQAIHASEKVILIDPFNTIAQKSLSKLKKLKNGHNISPAPLNASDFLEEPGKTRTVSLINLGDNKILAQLGSAEKVILKAHNHRVCVYTCNDKYIGRVADNIAAKLRKLIDLGCEYNTYIKTGNEHSVTIFMREIKK